MFAQDQVAELTPPAQAAPLDPPIAEIRGDSHEDLIAELVELARELGYTVTFADTGPADGTCNPQSKRIAVAERLEANGRLVALSTSWLTRWWLRIRTRRNWITHTGS